MGSPNTTRWAAVAPLVLSGCFFPGKGEESNLGHVRSTPQEDDPSAIAASLVRVIGPGYVAAAEAKPSILRSTVFVVFSDDERRFVARRCRWGPGRTNACELTELKADGSLARFAGPFDLGAVTDAQANTLRKELEDRLDDMNAIALARRWSVDDSSQPNVLMLDGAPGEDYEVAFRDDVLTISVKGTQPHQLGAVVFPPGTHRLFATYGNFKHRHLGAVLVDHEEDRGAGPFAYQTWVLFRHGAGQRDGIRVVPGLVDSPIVGRVVLGPGPTAAATTRAK